MSAVAEIKRNLEEAVVNNARYNNGYTAGEFSG